MNTTVSISSTITPLTDPGVKTDKDEQGGLVFVVLSCLCASLWAIYVTFYHARLMGYILTWLINLKYIKNGQYLKIGSFSFSILSGKIMFRDVVFVTKDLSFRIVDGIAIFKYWITYKPVISKKPYQLVPSDIEAENAEQRLMVWLNGLEYHMYNRSGLYNRLEEFFRVERYGDAAKSAQNIATAESRVDVEKSKGDEKSGLPTWLLELVPAIKYDINNGRVAFGNKILETTLCFKFESATGIYTTSQANSSLDEFMHLVKCQGKNVRVMLSPSPHYNGPRDEPPRYMGEGFVVLQTADCKVTYYQDEPGFVPEVRADSEIPDSDPHWGIDVVFLKNTTLCYGPWVDRQRDALQKFFFPLDYHEMPATKPLTPGQRRIHTGLDIKFDFECDSTVDILFSKNRVTKAVHLCVGLGSHVRVYQPWTVNEYGYTTSIVAKLFHMETTTSLAYRPVIEADVIEIAFHMSFPRIWNQTQHWSCDIVLRKVTWNFIFAHKFFFQEMVEDWSVNYKPDLLTFVPYEWNFNIVLRDFEMVWLGNQHNWIECTSNRHENAELAFCGEVFDLTFALQYLRFMPEVEDIKFFLQVEKLVARMFVPESNTLRRSFLSLARSGEKRMEQGPRSRSSTTTGNPDEAVESADEQLVSSGAEEAISGGWRRHTEESLGWVDVMSVPILGLALGYMYHPIYSGPRYEVPRDQELPCDPTNWEPDVISLELEAGPAALRLFGSLLKTLAAIKENYFGIDQEFKELGVKTNPDESLSENRLSSDSKNSINLQSLRPMEANIFVSLYEVKAELTKHCGFSERCSPLVLMERLSFEMHKTYTETRLQLHLSPTTILTGDGNMRGQVNQHLSQGHLSLSGLQFRGHAMFSGLDRPPDCETLEYAWLMELQLGVLSGKLTLPQIQALGNWAQTFAFHLIDKENKLRPSTPYVQCVHGKRQNVCDRRHKKRKVPRELECTEEPSEGASSKETTGRKKGPSQLCITEEDVKYHMTRVSIDSVNLFVVETGCACNVEVYPVRLATCSLHSSECNTGASLFVQTIKLRQFVLTPWPEKPPHVLSDARRPLSLVGNAAWLQAANVQFGPIVADISNATPKPEMHLEQKDFLEMHDFKFQRLWFLWQPQQQPSNKRHGYCGCVGGCNFFGKNSNGPRFFTAEKLDASENDTGISGFGSERGFYDDSDIVDSGSRPLMYSRSADLDALDSNYLDRTPAGSIEAFTRRRYTVSGSETSSPKMRRSAGHGQTAEEVFLQEHGIDKEDISPMPSRLSWGSSLHRDSNSISNMHEKMRRIRSTSLQGSRQSLGRSRKPSTSASAREGLVRSDSQFSHGSEVSFYSCGSLLDELDIAPAGSVESFVSAVEEPDDLMRFEDEASLASQFVVTSPALVHKYSQHLQQLECLNWSAPLVIPPEKRQFSIDQNMTETETCEEFTIPGVPQFTYQGGPKIELPLLVNKNQKTAHQERWQEEEDTLPSSSESDVTHNVTVKPPQQPHADPKKMESSEVLEASEHDSMRKTRWNTAINEADKTSASSSSECSPGNTLRKKRKPLRESTVMLRLVGDVNILVTPLLLDALQRYVTSISRQDNILHPSLVVDLVHDKCVDAAETLYRRREGEQFETRGVESLSNVSTSEEPKEKQMVVFFSTSKINMCFLQVTSFDNNEACSRDSIAELAKSPSVSLLAGSISGIRSELLSVRRKPSEQVCTIKKGEAETHPVSGASGKQSAHANEVLSPSLSEKKSPRHRNTMTTGSVSCAQIQLQLRKLCDKEDIVSCVTTVIPEESSRCEFQVNCDSYVSFTEGFDTQKLERNSTLNLLMMECNLDNVSFNAGSECASGSEVLPKIRDKRQAIALGGERSRLSLGKRVDPAEENRDNAGASATHGFKNPMFEREIGSFETSTSLTEHDKKSEASVSRISSLSSSLNSFRGSTSSGNDSDKESDADDDPIKPLLRSENRKQKGKNGSVELRRRPEQIDAELARRADATINFSNIWFNLASPSSFKAVPSNYHLYNSLVTTIVPFVTAWIPAVTQVRSAFQAFEKNYQRHLNSMFGCLLAQALPEYGRIARAHTVSSGATEKAEFLQEDHSSQLIYILRRQLLGSKLQKIRLALRLKTVMPDDQNLIKGIFALARQWKCFLAGTEKGEVAFYGSSSLKRRVVGRGVLTERDRAILLREERASRQEDVNVLLVKEPGDNKMATKYGGTGKNAEGVSVSVKAPEEPLALELEPLVSETTTKEAFLDVPRPVRTISQDTESDSDASPTATSSRRPPRATTFAEGKKMGHEKKLSLYSWLSSPPTTSPHLAQGKENMESSNKTAPLQHIPDSVSKLDSLGPGNRIVFSDMVSVPTSGKQIKDERETFKNFLQAINLMPRVAKQQDTASTFSLSAKLRYLHVHLVDGGFDNLSKKGKGKGKGKNRVEVEDRSKRRKQEKEPVFIARNFVFRLLHDESPLDILLNKAPEEENSKSTQMKFTVGCGSVTQRVNLSFVRLAIQIVDMLDLLLDSQVSGDDTDGPRVPSDANVTSAGDKTDGAQPGRSRVYHGSVKCWRIMYQVLDLYSSLPREARNKGYMRRSTIGRTLTAERMSPDKLRDVKIDIEDGLVEDRVRSGVHSPASLDKRRSMASRSTAEAAIDQEDALSVEPLSTVFGVVTLPKIKLLASIGGLILETEVREMNVSVSRKEQRGNNGDGRVNSSLAGHLGKINVVLLESSKLVTGTVVSCHLSRSHALYSSVAQSGEEKGNALVTLGMIVIDIPQHPVALHSMMTRSSRAISRHITDIQSQRSVIRSMGSFDVSSQSHLFRHRLSGVPSELSKFHQLVSPSTIKPFVPWDRVDGATTAQECAKIAFVCVLRGFGLGASLLPSLRAEYKIGRITGSGRKGKSSTFKLTMPVHSLSFTSKVASADNVILPATVVDLPPISMHGELISKPPRAAEGYSETKERFRQRSTVKNHLYASAEIGSFQHSLTTDLLNHLVFVQKSFMKEVNDVLQRVSGESQPVPLWRTASSDDVDAIQEKEIPLLYSFRLTLKGIQVTATTPSSTAVRLDTGVVALEVSNALPSPNLPGQLRRSTSYVRLFGKAQVDVNLSLGQFVKSQNIDNEFDFQQLAYFKTRIGVRNSFQDSNALAGTEDKETFLVTLTKPCLYVQQVAFDKAVLVYLNYKNAYEYWNEQRLSLNKEVHFATQAVLDKLPQRPPASQLSGSLFLQLTVDQLGVCIPLYNGSQALGQSFQMRYADQEPGPAVVLTVENMLLSCCSSVSFVSKGKFSIFSLWFADKFDTEAKDWKPDFADRLMNRCLVPEGTYELCSRTQRYPITQDMVKAGKWVLSLQWRMRGIEVHCDTNIGKRLSSLGQTLTALTGEPDIANIESISELQDREVSLEDEIQGNDEVDNTGRSSEKRKSKNIEMDMWEQARKVNELRRKTGVESDVMEKETRRLQDLESAVFNEFRKDVRKRLRRQSRSGRMSLVKRADSDKHNVVNRKAMSERVRGSRTRSRIRHQPSSDIEEVESEMVEMPLMPPTFASVDESEHAILEHRSPSLPDVLIVGSKASKPYASTPLEDPLPLRSLASPEGETGVGPRVTFRTLSESDYDSGASERSVSFQQQQQQPQQQQQNLDFELDVTVDIDSGKCVLHPSCDTEKDEVVDPKAPGKRLLISDATQSKIFSPTYPSTSGQKRYKPVSQEKPTLPEATVLLLPAVDVRVHYHSNIDSELLGSQLSPEMPTASTSLDPSAGSESSILFPGTLEQEGGAGEAIYVSITPNRKIVKKAGLYVWVLFQALPQEMVLKPGLLDFIEQALQPISIPGEDDTVDGGGLASGDESDTEGEVSGSVVSSSVSEYSSFPVDVVVVIRVQPSDIRFSCLPVSRVECMLRLPAVDVVFSSNSSPNKSFALSPSGRPTSWDQSRARMDQSNSTFPPSLTFDSGGISFTVCLSRFSFCIFHPYGKQHTGLGRVPSSSSDHEENAEENRPRFRFSPSQPLSGKKDSLSLNVEFVKFNLARRRLGSVGGVMEDRARVASLDLLAGTRAGSSTIVKVSGICDIGSAAFNYDLRRLNEILDFPKAWYKRSLVQRLFLGKEGSYATKAAAMGSEMAGDISSKAKPTSEEIKARSLSVNERKRDVASARHKPTLIRSMSEDREQQAPSTPLKSPASRHKPGHRKAAASGSSFFGFLPTSPNLFRSMTMSGTRQGLLSSKSPSAVSPHTPRRSTMSGSVRHAMPELKIIEQSSSETEVDGGLSQSSSSSLGGNRSKWETLVVVAVNLSRLDVSTNMGSVMGQTFWSTSDLRSQCHVTLTNSGRRELKGFVSVRQALYEARSGIVGGHIEIQELKCRADINEERGTDPEHQIHLSLRYAEARVDYMGTCILMGNLCVFKTDLHDEWTLQETTSPSTESLFENEREPVNAKIYMHGDLSWNDFKIMISRSTTPDMAKTVAKIEEFLAQQHRNSIRALCSLRPQNPLSTGDVLSSLSAPVCPGSQVGDKEDSKDGLKYQHWGKVLNAVRGLRLSVLSDRLPEKGVLLGGTLTLRGKAVSLACFHGVNFRAQSWVLFNLQRPYMTFSSKVCTAEKSCQVRRVKAVQDFLLRLGHGEEDVLTGKLSPSSAIVGIIQKVSRGRRNPPSMGSSVQDWLNYVCATGEGDIPPSENTFSPTEKSRSEPVTSPTKPTSQRERRSSYTSSLRYEHDTEAIFAIPKFEVELQSEHDMPMTSIASKWVKKGRGTPAVPPPATPASPHVVETSFSSCFDDGLCVTVDVGLLFFLHDVVQTYIKENETASSGSISRGMSPPTRVRRERLNEKEDREKSTKTEAKRIRQFRSKHWKLQPRVRFLSWAGKNMDPVNIDWVLQKLGFAHAHLTIPKWAQRGAMDPMDSFLSLLIDRLLAGMQESASYLEDED